MTNVDIVELLGRMQDTLDESRGIALTRDELDELLWTIAELELGHQMQAHLIAMYEAQQETPASLN